MQADQLTIDAISTEQLEQILAERKAQAEVNASLKRKQYEDLREDIVAKGCARALVISEALKDFKASIFGECNALYSLLQEYSNRHADGEGNFTIENRDCTLKIAYSRQNLGYFDERSGQAEKHIIDFVNSQFSGDPTTKKLITSLLERTKGKLDIKLVQKLYSMENEYQDANWKEGIRLLKESWLPTDSKDYIRFYQKKENGEYELINLNFSSAKTA